MDKVVFTGCSFTAGAGWGEIDTADPSLRDIRDHSNLYVSLCHTNLSQLKNLEVVNYGQTGASNTEIFINTAEMISKFSKEIKILFCQWTAMPRYNFSVGFELWSTDEGISTRARSKYDVNLNKGVSYNRKYLNDLLDRLLAMHHLHPEILKVVKYSNILQNLAQAFGIKLYFINGLCPWDQNYFVKLSGVLPEEYTLFTKKEILNIESRDDKDIFKLYDIMHTDYAQAGGINPSQWVNLYDPMISNKIDTNHDNQHPGTKSNQLYFEQIKKFLETQ